MSLRIGIVGGGIAGRLIAWQASRRGYQVTLFADLSETSHASHAAAGMLAPISELETEAASVARLGIWSLEQWVRYERELASNVYFQRAGTLILSHSRDRSERERFQRSLEEKGFASFFRSCDSHEVQQLEPALSGRFSEAWFCPIEGQVDARGCLRALAERLASLVCVQAEPVNRILPGEVTTQRGSFKFDWVIDARGFHAQQEWPALRAVRGERLTLHSEISFRRPIRFLHPRYPLYLVPRPQGEILIGATLIESTDTGPITVRSSLELLSASFAVHPGLGEARVIETITQLRAALPDNLPQVQIQGGLIRVNGLYRHGFLLGPALTEITLAAMREEVLAQETKPFLLRCA